MKFKVMGLIAAALVSGIVRAAPTTIFDTITGNTFAGGGFWTGFDPDFNLTATVGDKFTATSSGFISFIKFAANGDLLPTVGIYLDEGGKIGGLLETLSLTGSAPFGTYAQGSFRSGENLNVGESYWAVMGAGPFETWWGMAGVPNQDTYVQIGPTFSTTDGTLLPESLGMLIDVSQVSSSVPEPATLSLLGLGLVGVGFMRRRNKNLTAA